MKELVILVIFMIVSNIMECNAVSQDKMESTSVEMSINCTETVFT
jgi:hypothetical protein